jgi:ribosome small subunit-dependent GTPase A
MAQVSLEGLVMKSTGSWYTVLSDNGEMVHCKIRGKLRLKGLKTTNPIAVGDRVCFTLEDSMGQITEVKERKNYIIRKSSNLSREAHILAANLDHAFLVITPEFPKTPLEFIDRFLLTAEAYRIPTSIVINKVDLFVGVLEEELNFYKEVYTKAGYDVYETSARKGIGLDNLKGKMKNKITVLSGNSGVGKSTLINAIDPSYSLRTGDISLYHLKGKHTTTFYEMVALKFGGFIIDTPGIKGFGIVDITESELSHYFPDIFKFASGCRFSNCTHVHEPGCSVIEAVKEGKIGLSRYNSYINILSDGDEKYRNPF